MPTHEDFNEIIQLFLTLQIINKLYHWNTSSFARHTATDNFGIELSNLTDKFVEIFIGRYTIKPQITQINLNHTYLTNNGIIFIFKQTRKYLENMNKKIADTDLLSIKDDILVEVNKILYLFTLN